MRIAFFTQLYMPDTGGAEIILNRLINSLRKRGHQTVLIAPTKVNTDISLDYPVVRTLRPFSKSFLVHSLPPLLYAFTRYRFDLIHCQSEYFTAYVAHLFKKIAHVPYVVRGLGGEFMSVIEKPQHESRLRAAIASADGLIAQGEFLRSQFLQFGANPDKITTIHNGVERAEILVKGRNPRPLPFIFYVGGLRHVKGYDILLQAFSKIADDIAPTQLVMAGNKQQWEQFDQLRENLGLTPDRVDFVGKLKRRQVALHYQYARLYVCPFREAPFSNANLEAMTAGTPIVATSVDGNLEQIRDGEEGFLVASEDVDGLAAAMKRICADSDLRAQLSKNAAKRAHDFDWDKMVDQYERYYQSILGAVGQSETNY